MKFALILSGCGVNDGAEIQEAVLSMLAVAANGATYQVFAPNVMQHHVVNHLTGEVMKESRNVLIEAARIARGNIKPMAEYSADEFDAIILPGGFGVAKNLCSYAFDGTDMKIDRVVEKAIRDTHAAGKPICALCISPVLLTKILGNVEVTVGDDKTASDDIVAMGGKHVKTGNGQVVVDRLNKVVTSPCYMLDATITDIAEDTDKAVKALISLV